MTAAPRRRWFRIIVAVAIVAAAVAGALRGEFVTLGLVAIGVLTLLNIRMAGMLLASGRKNLAATLLSLPIVAGALGIFWLLR